MSWYEKATKKNRIYVIAELGSNYVSREQLLGAINLAKMCGADAIKYQYFDESELYGPEPKLKVDFPFGDLKLKCDSAGIDFLCSSFSPQGMMELDKYVEAHKIASSEMSHVRMLEVAKSIGKPVLLSTGGYFPKDIMRTLKFMDKHPLVLMHCNLAYPAALADLKKLEEIQSFYDGPIGFSDHTTSIDAVPLLMKSKGVVVYEKHFNPYGFTHTPDAPHSLDIDQFKTFVSYLRGMPNDYSEENEARLKHVRRVVATRDILPGERFIEGENVGIFRSRNNDSNGANPFSIDRMVGRVAKRGFKAGEGVSVGDAE